MYFGLNKYVKLSSSVSSKGCEQLLQKSHVHKVTGDHVCPSTVTGLDYLTDSRLNKGLAYTIEERQTLGIHGLLPCSYRSQEAQVHLCKQIFEGYKKDLNKYVYLAELQDRNEKLFYRLVGENIKAMLPIVYTPTVGVACQKFGLIFTRPRGLFISLNDKGHVYDVIRNWPEPDVRAIVVTDGERILGLGDLGAFGMGIPVGKLSLYTALAGIKPHQCLPILIDVGTNNEALLNNLEYIGLRQKRPTGKEYDEFLDEFMLSVVRRYGQNTLVQFEDFGNQNAFRLLEKYRNTYCTFNDDIQGTAAVALGGLLAAQRMTGKKISQHKILFFGAGGAGAGIANLCIKAMISEGLTSKQAYDNVWLVDVDGLLTNQRPKEKLIEFQIPFATDHEPMSSLHEIIKEFKPSVLIGVSASTGAFTPEILLDMATINERPIVFALSNPTSKAECTAQDAYDHTGGKVIYSSGSPFPPVQYNNKEYVTGQGNNAYIFPGIALGVILSRCHHIPEDIFLIAARCLSEHVTDEQINSGSVFPPLDLIRELSVDLATRVVEFAYEQGLSSVYPEPRNKLEWVKGQMYNYHYYTNMPRIWRYPDGPYEHKL